MKGLSPLTNFSSWEHSQVLSDPVMLSWRAFDRAAELPCRVTPAVPILFFGDLNGYFASKFRVVTVGLNPSLHEFPAGDSFRRFPSARGHRGREPDCYLDAMSAYFRTRPYRSWFSSFEALLNGMEASYYSCQASTALHTDICSPVATDPTWSGLADTDRAALEAEGGALWHSLLEKLRPQIVVISVARAHLKRIKFAPLSRRKIVCGFSRKADGTLRSKPYEMSGRWHNVGGERSLFAHGPAAQKPFGLLADSQKRLAGERLLKAYNNSIQMLDGR